MVSSFLSLNEGYSYLSSYLSGPPLPVCVCVLKTSYLSCVSLCPEDQLPVRPTFTCVSLCSEDQLPVLCVCVLKTSYLSCVSVS